MTFSLASYIQFGCLAPKCGFFMDLLDLIIQTQATSTSESQAMNPKLSESSTAAMDLKLTLIFSATFE